MVVCIDAKKDRIKNNYWIGQSVMETEISNIWVVWIDETNKVISTKEIPTGKKTQFINKKLGIDAINRLLSKGFKIG